MCVHRIWKRQRLSPSAWLPQSAWCAVECEEAVCELDGDECGNPDGDEPWLCGHFEPAAMPCPNCGEELLCAAWLAEDMEMKKAAASANAAPELAEDVEMKKAAGNDTPELAAGAAARKTESGTDVLAPERRTDAPEAESGTDAPETESRVDAPKSAGANCWHWLSPGLKWLSLELPRMRRAADGQLYCACQTHGDEASLNETWAEYQEWQTDSQNPHFTSRLLIVIPTDNESLLRNY